MPSEPSASSRAASAWLATYESGSRHGSEASIPTQVVQICRDVGEVVVVGDDLARRPADLVDLHLLVEGDLRLTGLDIYRRIPCATVGPLNRLPSGCGWQNAAFTMWA